MNRWSRISGLGAVAVTVPGAGAGAGSLAPAAGLAQEADDPPPVNLNDGQRPNSDQLKQAREQAANASAGDAPLWPFYLKSGKGNWAQLGTGLPVPRPSTSSSLATGPRFTPRHSAQASIRYRFPKADPRPGPSRRPWEGART
jgi:hypothetical protein